LTGAILRPFTYELLPVNLRLHQRGNPLFTAWAAATVPVCSDVEWRPITVYILQKSPTEVYLCAEACYI